jgi:hypothetical protein
VRVDRSHGVRTRGGDPAPTTYREPAQHARLSPARTRSPARSIAGVKTTHDQTTNDAPCVRRGARERLAPGAAPAGGGPRGADRPPPYLRSRLARGDVARQAAHQVRRSSLEQPRNTEAGDPSGALRVQPQPTRVQLGRLRRALPAGQPVLAWACRPMGTGRPLGVQRTSERHRLDPDGARVWLMGRLERVRLSTPRGARGRDRTTPAPPSPQPGLVPGA